MNIFSNEPYDNKSLFNYYTFTLLQIYLYHFKMYFSFYCHFFIYIYIFFFEKISLHLLIIYYFHNLRKKFMNIFHHTKKYLLFIIKNIIKGFNSKLSDEEIDYKSDLINNSDLLILKSEIEKNMFNDLKFKNNNKVDLISEFINNDKKISIKKKIKYYKKKKYYYDKKIFHLNNNCNNKEKKTILLTKKLEKYFLNNNLLCKICYNYVEKGKKIYICSKNIIHSNKKCKYLDNKKTFFKITNDEYKLVSNMHVFCDYCYLIEHNCIKI